jgi:glutathione peroxidase
MGPLQVLEDTFGSQGFRVLGFYSNDFGNQGGSDEQIDSCTESHMVSFLQFEIGHVRYGNDYVPRPVFEWILSQPDPGPASGGLEPTWNFHKYLISRDGQLVAHFGQLEWPGDDPNDPNDSFETSPIVIAIEDELAK